MKRLVIKKPQAERDLLEYFVYLGRDSPEAAGRFLEEAEAAFDRLAEMPRTGAIWESDDPRLSGIRYESISR